MTKKKAMNEKKGARRGGSSAVAAAGLDPAAMEYVNTIAELISLFDETEKIAGFATGMVALVEKYVELDRAPATRADLLSLCCGLESVAATLSTIRAEGSKCVEILNEHHNLNERCPVVRVG